MCMAGLMLLSDGEICIWLTDIMMQQKKKKKEGRMCFKYFCYTEFLVFYPLLYKLLLLVFLKTRLFPPSQLNLFSFEKP